VKSVMLEFTDQLCHEHGLARYFEPTMPTTGIHVVVFRHVTALWRGEASKPWPCDLARYTFWIMQEARVMAGFLQIRRIPDGDTHPVMGHHFGDDLLSFRGDLRPD